MTDDVLICDQCNRKAVMKVYAKWPSKKMHKLVCGYHLRPYKTSEFRRVEVNKTEKKERVGYIEPPKVMARVNKGYAPV